MSEERLGSKPTPYEQTKALMEKYGSIDAIPDVELLDLGFTKATPETHGYSGIIRVKTPSSLVGSTEQGWSEKVQNTPFGRIEVPIGKVTRGFFYRHIDEDLPLVSKRIQAIGRIDYFDEEPPATVIGGALAQLDKQSKALSEARVIEHGFGLIVFDYSLRPFFEIPLSKSPLRDEDAFLSRCTSEYGLMTTSDSEGMFNELEKQKGQLGDVAEIEREFTRIMGQPIFEGKYTKMVAMESLRRYCNLHGLNTNFDLARHTFTLLLDQVGLPTVSSNLQGCSSVEQINNLLPQLRSVITKELIEEEKQVKRVIKSTDTSDREALATLNQRLAEISAAKRERVSVIDGITDFCSLPRLISEVFKRRIKAVQDLLIQKTKSSEEEVQTAFYLDATPNSELDSNPGEVSGDCTIGRPLPFARPDIPVYNAKVFDLREAHIGNIYLLQTVTESALQERVWHLEAIQIPRPTFDWDTTIANIITRISREARAKGVPWLTINTIPEQTSNYDYIAEAAQAYFDSHSAKDKFIVIPKVPDVGRYSEFQSSGEVYALSTEEGDNSSD